METHEHLYKKIRPASLHGSWTFVTDGTRSARRLVAQGWSQGSSGFGLRKVWKMSCNIGQVQPEHASHHSPSGQAFSLWHLMAILLPVACLSLGVQFLNQKLYSLQISSEFWACTVLQTWGRWDPACSGTPEMYNRSYRGRVTGLCLCCRPLSPGGMMPRCAG